MNTFLPYKSFGQSAKVLDYKRLGNQRNECLYILQTLLKGPYICSCCKKRVIFDDNKYKTTDCCGSKIIKTPYYYHPAVQMWKNHEHELIIYTGYIITEWILRGYKDTCYDKLSTLACEFKNVLSIYNKPDWLGNEKLHSSHRAALLFKNFEWYRQFNWFENPKIDYYWPINGRV